MTMAENITKVESAIADLTGLTEEVFLFVRRITPMINAGLLIKNPDGAILLTWRDDGYWSTRHIPGGIVRYKETMAECILKMAQHELETGVEFRPEPLMSKKIIHLVRKNRSHFISMLFACRLTGTPDEKLRYLHTAPLLGQFSVRKICSQVHEIYCNYNMN